MLASTLLALAQDPPVPPTPAPVERCSQPTGDLCFGIGEYKLGTPVTEGKCPQLPLWSTDAEGKRIPTMVVQRFCMIEGHDEPVTDSKCFSDEKAVWVSQPVSGVGLNGERNTATRNEYVCIACSDPNLALASLDCFRRLLDGL